MTDYVVDTNVWVWVDKTIADVTSIAELDCIEACRAWLEHFLNSEDRLIVDTTYAILGEYRRNIRQEGRAAQLFGQIEVHPQTRIVQVSIEFDHNNHAVLPEDFAAFDPSDRKFVAVSLQFQPPAPIINATDTDWDEVKEILAQYVITVEEICAAYIAHKRK